MYKHPVLWILTLLLLAGFVRFYNLGEGALRSDELNRYLEGRSELTLLEYWRAWQPTNQIPLQNVLSMGVARLLGEVNENNLRVPGAIMGILTVLLLAIWVGRHWGAPAGLFTGIWLALNPYHLHESREAYYYGMLMFASAIFSIYTIEIMRRLRQTRTAMNWPATAAWLASAWFLCMSHMSTWIYTLLWAGSLFTVGMLYLPKKEKIRHAIRLITSGFLLLFLMRRWIRDAIGEVRKVSEQADYEYLGDSLAEVAPRVLPMFLAGANWLGLLLLLLTLAAALLIWRHRKEAAQDLRYALLTVLTLLSVALLYVYIGLVGGGVAKETFFSACFPVLLAWSALTLWKAAGQLLPARPIPPLTPRSFFAMATVVLLVLLAFPAWHIIHLDGKPTPYNQIRERLDHELPPGTVVIIDRWFEPWNEMVAYAPTNVFVTFTVPDEPYEIYQQMNWRDVTRRAFETGSAQAFLRLTRNHEEQAGLWQWPEQFFGRKVEIVNEHALWLRKTGFSVMSGLYAPNTNRMISHLFYNTDEDWADHARSQGKNTLLLYGTGWGHLKPWRPMPGWSEQLMQLLWMQAGAYTERGRTFADLSELQQLSHAQAIHYLQRGQWMNYRVAGRHSTWRLFNLSEHDVEARLHVVAIALSGPIQMRLGRTRLEFPSTRLVEHRIPLTLHPGEQALPFPVHNDQYLLVLHAGLDES